MTAPDSPSIPRIEPGTRADIGLINYAIAQLLGVGLGTSAPNIFTTIARSPRLFRHWLWFASALMPNGRLARADTELIILRVARNCGSDYEWRAHEGLALAAGLAPEALEQVRGGSVTEALDDHQSLLLRAVDELHADRVLSNVTWLQLAARFRDAELIELCMLVGHYEMLAMTLNSLGVQPDPPRPPDLPALTRLLQRLVSWRPGWERRP